MGTTELSRSGSALTLCCGAGGWERSLHLDLHPISCAAFAAWVNRLLKQACLLRGGWVSSHLSLALRLPTHMSSRSATIEYPRTGTATNLESEPTSLRKCHDPAKTRSNHIEWVQTTPMPMDRACISASSGRRVTGLDIST
jgi:hypothetical protein